MKKIWIFLLLVLPLLFCSDCSMFGYHKIDYPKKSDLITDCPSYAREGKTVHFSTVIVCDAVLNVDLSGAELITIQEGEYEFVMPDHDVSIRVWISAPDWGDGA